MNGPDALRLAETESPDIVLLDIMMPGMDGFEVCRRLKADPRLAHIPVVMVTALSDVADRVQGLEAGADDFLTKPVNDLALMARVKSLVRMKMTMDELRLREQTSQSFGVIEISPQRISTVGGRILAVEERGHSARTITDVLSSEHAVSVLSDPAAVLARVRCETFDLVIVSLSLRTADGLRMCAQLRSIEESRQVPLLVLVDDNPAEMQRLAKGMELGVSDYLIRPVDRNELLARARTQIRRRRYEERLRQNYQQSVALAATDELTGLYNRRYLTTHLDAMLERMVQSQRPLSVMLLDIDHFKPVNDTYGHEAGDTVLAEFARRLMRGIRGVDLATRYGGEEFVVVMPDTAQDVAIGVAERLRRAIADQTFVLPNGGTLTATVSIGLATSHDGDDPSSLIRRADIALYAAKAAGRNRVMAEVCEPEVSGADARVG